MCVLLFSPAVWRRFGAEDEEIENFIAPTSTLRLIDSFSDKNTKVVAFNVREWKVCPS
jgi:hypothetical protein